MKCSECKNNVRPVVALDIDGTLGDYHSHFIQFAEGWLNKKLPQHNMYDGTTRFWEYLGLELTQYREIKLAYRQGGLKRTMPAYSFASELTRQLRQAGAEIWICTTRPYLRLDNIDPDTRAWLDRNNIYYDHMIYGDDKYRQLDNIVDKERIVGVLDDLPDHVEDAFHRDMDPVLRHNYHNHAFRLRMNIPFVMIAPHLAAAASQLVLRVRQWYAVH